MLLISGVLAASLATLPHAIVGAQVSGARGSGETRPAATTQPAAGEWLRVWSDGNLDIAARADGWVEVRANVSPADVRGRHDVVPLQDRYPPELVRQWIDSTRQWIARAGATDSTSHAPRLAYRRSQSLSLGISHSDRSRGPDVWTFSAHSCEMSAGGVFRSEPPLGLLAAFDSAARTASAARTVPLPIDPTVIRDEVTVPCRAREEPRARRMPADPGRDHRNDTLPPVEVLARFTVTATGAVDTASLETHPAVEPSLRAALAIAVAGWRFRPGSLGGVNVAQRVHRVIRFVNPHDSVDAVRFDTFANARRPQWMARGDGLVEWTGVFDRTIREASTATDVLAWLADIAALRARATPPLDDVEPALPAGGPSFQASRATPWLAMLGRGDGARLAVAFHRDPASDTVVRGMLHAPCGSPLSSYMPRQLAPDTLLPRAGQAARAALAMHATPRIDTMRVYGELEVTCPAQHGGAAYGESVIVDSLRRALALPREAVVAFVITRTGVVDQSSIHIFGEWTNAQRARIAGAVAPLRFVPGRFAGYAVAQRSHVVIGVPDRTGPGSLDTVRELCIGGGTLAVQLRALVPSTGIPRRDLAEIGQRLITMARRTAAPRPFRGTVQFVAMPDQPAAAFVRWMTPPPDTTRDVRTLDVMQFGPLAPPGRLNSQPYGIEATFTEGCR